VKWFKLFRPHHWVKNSLLFVPLIFSENLLDFTLLTKSIIAFLYFCLLSSGVYIINDIFDVEQDRQHPLKRNRPIAAGTISVRSAATIAALLLTLSLFGSFKLQPMFGIIAVIYVGIELLYTLRLKKIVILDAFCVAAGFVLRVAGGTVAIQAPISSWLFICAGLLALFLIFAKRRTELLRLDKGAANHRQVLSQYNTYYLDQMITLTATTTLGVYLIYILDADTVAKFGKTFALTIPFVFYGIFRYQFLIYHKADTHEDPVGNLLSDIPLLASCVLWVLSVVLIMYL